MTPQTIGVLVCSVGRIGPLLTCLEALARQTRPPDEVLVIVRPDDAPTHAGLRAREDDGLRWRMVVAHAPGLVAARNAGLAACRTDIVAFCDDDACAHPEWTARIVAHFAADPALGGLGGRDRCHDGERFDDARRAVVGRVQWFGRTIGNHHLGHGAPQPVHFIKGVNMSYRAQAIAGRRFDERLRGRAVQTHDDVAFSLTLHRAGWKLLYDPAVAVDHYVYSADRGRRTYVAGGGLGNPQDYFDTCYNRAQTVWEWLRPGGRVAFAVWSSVIGTRLHPGLVQVLRLLPGEGVSIWRKFLLCQRATMAFYRRGREAV